MKLLIYFEKAPKRINKVDIVHLSSFVVTLGFRDSIMLHKEKHLKYFLRSISLKIMTTLEQIYCFRIV